MNENTERARRAREQVDKQRERDAIAEREKTNERRARAAHRNGVGVMGAKVTDDELLSLSAQGVSDREIARTHRMSATMVRIRLRRARLRPSGKFRRASEEE